MWYLRYVWDRVVVWVLIRELRRAAWPGEAAATVHTLGSNLRGSDPGA